jgi:hypothetical protein
MNDDSDQDLDLRIRLISKTLHRREITPEQAEKVITELGWGDWG